MEREQKPDYHYRNQDDGSFAVTRVLILECSSGLIRTPLKDGMIFALSSRAVRTRSDL